MRQVWVPEITGQSFRNPQAILVAWHGQNLVIEELVELRMDVIVAVSSAAVQAAKEATKTVPIANQRGSNAR